MFAQRVAQLGRDRNVHCKPSKRGYIDAVRLYQSTRSVRALGTRGAHLEVEGGNALVRRRHERKSIGFELQATDAIIGAP